MSDHIADAGKMVPSPSDKKIARELLESAVDRSDFATKDILTASGNLKNDIINRVAEALSRVREEATKKEREKIAKFVDGLDPLEASGDWENPELIAYAVQEFISTEIRRNRGRES